MTVLTAVNQACKEALSINTFPALFEASQETDTVLEMRAVAKAAAKYILSDYDWPALKKIATITGDGATEDFDLPVNYSRMVTKTGLWSSAKSCVLRRVIGDDEWLSLVTLGNYSTFGAWTLYEDQIHIKPAPADGEVIRYFYISDLYAQQTDSTYASEFAYDTDVFRIDERLLTCAIIWQWKAAKGLSYAEDLQTYEREKEKLVARAKGSRMIRVGNVRLPADVEIAYPLNVGV
jgi:hypothetical protein